MLLADELIERAGAHAVGERTVRAARIEERGLPWWAAIRFGHHQRSCEKVGIELVGIELAG
jgi:hypothetical protein